MRTAAILVGVFLVIAVLLVGGLSVGWIFVQNGGGSGLESEWGWGYHPDFWSAGSGWLGMLLMMLAMVFLWLLFPVGIGLLVWFFYTQGRPGTPSDRQEAPLDLLRRRYAQGEIDRDEFLRRKETLQG